MIKNFFDKQNIEYIENASLKKYNTYRIESTAKFLVFPKNVEELIEIIRKIEELSLKYIVIGNGSNIILAKEYYDDIIIKLDYFKNVEFNDNIVTSESGYSLIKLANDTINQGLSGLEFATSIPGSVGASTVVNAGAYKSELSDVVKSVKVLNKDYQIEEITKDDMHYSYRDSILKNNKNYIVLSTTFELKKGDIEEMKKQSEDRRKKRISTQPLNLPNAGSVFRNPENKFAGELIEKCNLKGFNINGAEISKKHANFIVNTKNAKGKDILKLIEIIKKEVKENYNVELNLEQIVIE